MKLNKFIRTNGVDTAIVIRLSAAQPRNHVSIPSKIKEFVTPAWLWCTPNILPNRYQGIFPKDSGEVLKLTIRLQQMT
jgi:hypothetical protein